MKSYYSENNMISMVKMTTMVIISDAILATVIAIMVMERQ